MHAHARRAPRAATSSRRASSPSERARDARVARWPPASFTSRGATLDALAAVRALRAAGLLAYATMDAGPHLEVPRPRRPRCRGGARSSRARSGRPPRARRARPATAPASCRRRGARREGLRSRQARAHRRLRRARRRARDRHRRRTAARRRRARARTRRSTPRSAPPSATRPPARRRLGAVRRRDEAGPRRERRRPRRVARGARRRAAPTSRRAVRCVALRSAPAPRTRGARSAAAASTSRRASTAACSLRHGRARRRTASLPRGLPQPRVSRFCSGRAHARASSAPASTRLRVGDPAAHATCIADLAARPRRGAVRRATAATPPRFVVALRRDAHALLAASAQRAGAPIVPPGFDDARGARRARASRRSPSPAPAAGTSRVYRRRSCAASPASSIVRSRSASSRVDVALDATECGPRRVAR